MTTKIMKYQIKYEKELYNLLREVQYQTWKVKNKAITYAYDWQEFSSSYNERFGKYPKDKEITGKSILADIDNLTKHLAPDVASSTVNSSSKHSIEKFKTEKVDVLKGNKSISTFRRDGSFPMRATQIKVINKESSREYSCNLSLLSREGAKKRNCKTQVPVILRSGAGANEIMDRVISGEYKLCDSNISYKKNKFYLNLTYSFEPEKEVLDENKVMGVDVGVNVPAYLAVNYDDFYRQGVGSIEEIRQFENQMLKRKRSLQQQRKWCGEGSIGHGTKTRLKPLDKLSGKIANFKDTKNHNWSRYIVYQAVKMGCGTIQMEDLTGISENNTFLKTWTYYDLQQKITYKAKEKGIQVVKIKPNYTSSRCSKCGHIHRSKDKKEWRETQDQFKCQNCDFGHKFYVNADWNAARNISTVGIESIIQDTLKEQDKQLKHHMKYID